MNNLPAIILSWLILAIILVLKGLALWRAARSGQKNWFIAMIILYLYTFGIVELVYLFFFAKDKLTKKDLVFWNKKK